MFSLHQQIRSDPNQNMDVADKNWINVISDREIFVDGELTSINKTINVDGNDNMFSLITSYPNVVHTALKCKYADNVIDILQTFYEIILFSLTSLRKEPNKIPSNNFDFDDLVKKWIKKIIDHLNETKTYIAKMIYNLFFYSDKNQELRTTDQNLLKSFLSINLFLYYSKTKNPFIVYKNLAEMISDKSNITKEVDLDKTLNAVGILNNSIVQMISVLESFRCKNCFVKNPYNNNVQIRFDLYHRTRVSKDTQIITQIIEPKLSALNKLIFNEPVNNNDFDDKMYDPEHILLGDIFQNENSVFESAFLTFGEHSISFKQFYDIGIKSYNIEAIFNYQNTLFNVISAIFGRQILNMLDNSDKIPIDSEITTIFDSLDQFVRKIMPNNYSSQNCEFIITMRNLLYLGLRNFNQGINLEYTRISNLKKELQSWFEGKYWNSKKNLKNVMSLSLPTLVKNILQSNDFKPFSQVVKLLSYESNNNFKHHILKVHDMPIENSNPKIEGDNPVLHLMYELRLTLLFFWSLCLNMCHNNQSQNVTEHKTSSDVDVKKSFMWSVHICILSYDKMNGQNDVEVKNILSPLLIHFEHIDENSFDNLSATDFVKLEHTLLLTVNAIENYLIQEHKYKPIYNLNIYIGRMLNAEQNLDLETTINFFRTKIEETTRNSDNLTKVLKRLNTIYIQIYKCCDGDMPRNEQNLNFFWNGKKTSVSNDIFRNMVQGIFDYQDLIRYQWLRIKLCIAKFFEKIKYVLIVIDLELKQNHLHQSSSLIRMDLKNVVDKFLGIKTPESVINFIKPVIEMFDIVLTGNPSNFKFNEVYVDFTKKLIEEKLISLGVAFENSSYLSIQNICEYLESDHHEFAELLQVLQTVIKKTKLISDQVCFSTSLFPVDNYKV